MLNPYMPSIGQATNTRLDSSCKHIQQCKVSQDDMLRFVDNDVEELKRQKHRYKMGKDEFAIGIGRPWAGNQVVKRTANQAYPRVVSNLGALGDSDKGRTAVRMIRFMNHFARSIDERQKIIKFFENDTYVEPRIRPAGAAAGTNMVAKPGWECFTGRAGTDGAARRMVMNTAVNLRLMSDFIPVGFANTEGWAHETTGDSATSIMIGGLRTVMNGDFEIFPGDLVQFYFPFERNDFTAEGRRKPYIDIWDGNVPCNVDPSITETLSRKRNVSEVETSWNPSDAAVIREANQSLQYGAAPGRAKLVAYIKPYFPDDDHPRIMDWRRVFGKAICAARPHEMVDVHIQRQSM